jgi:aconitate hydratase
VAVHARRGASGSGSGGPDAGGAAGAGGAEAGQSGDGAVEFRARVRIDTPREAEYFRHGGILQYVLRQLAE